MKRRDLPMLSRLVMAVVVGAAAGPLVSRSAALDAQHVGETASTGVSRPVQMAGDSSRIAVLSLTSRIFRNTRAIRVYLPPGYDDSVNASRRYPVLYLNDGFAVLSPRGWNAPRALDSLVRERVIPPLIVVGIDNAATIPGASNPIRDRTNEYLPYPDSTEPTVPEPRGLEYPAFVVDEVMPIVTRAFRTASGPATTGIGGSSYGGIAALVTVLRRPGVFGALLLESTPLFLFGGRLIEEARSLQTWPGAVYVGVGTRETDDPHVLATGATALNRFVDFARATSPRTRVEYNVVEGATHTSRAWGARLPAALTFLYGGHGGVAPTPRVSPPDAAPQAPQADFGSGLMRTDRGMMFRMMLRESWQAPRAALATEALGGAVGSAVGMGAVLLASDCGVDDLACGIVSVVAAGAVGAVGATLGTTLVARRTGAPHSVAGAALGAILGTGVGLGVHYLLNRNSDRNLGDMIVLPIFAISQGLFAAIGGRW